MPWIVALVLVVAIILGARYFQHQRIVHQQTIAVAPGATASASTPATAAAAATAASAPSPRFPIANVVAPAPASSAALPPLGNSDAKVSAQMTHMLGNDDLAHFLASSHLIQRFVATIDALPRHKADRRIFPLKPPATPFTATRVGSQLQLTAADFARYDMYMDWVRGADLTQWIAWYKHTYPLFQAAYRQLGYPDGFFNDRLVAVIDNLLAAPEPKGPILIEQTDAGYVFADPALENLSVGQKLMVRVGPANEKILKQKLRVLRAALAGKNQRSVGSVALH